MSAFIKVLAVVGGIVGLLKLSDAAAWTGDHSNRRESFTLGAILFLLAFVLWRAA